MSWFDNLQMPQPTPTAPTTTAGGDWFHQNSPTGYQSETGGWNGQTIDPSQLQVQPGPWTGTNFNQNDYTPDPNRPGYSLSGQVLYHAAGSGTPAQTGTGGAAMQPPAGNDPNAIRQWVIQTATANGQTAIASNPDYWVQQIQKVGGVGDGSYWTDRIKSGGGGGDQPGGGSFGGFNANSPLLAPFQGQVPQFQAPTGLDFTNDPGYQARLKMGTDALQNSAFAHGKGLTGGTLKDLTQFAQDYASNEFGNVFNRALQGYNANLQGFDRTYDVFRNNQNDPFNKLYSLTGLGLSAANSANSAANAYGNNLGQNQSAYINVGQNYGNQAGNYLTQQGNAGALGSLGTGYNNAGLTNQIGGALSEWYKKYSQGGAGAPLQ